MDSEESARQNKFLKKDVILWHEKRAGTRQLPAGETKLEFTMTISDQEALPSFKHANANVTYIAEARLEFSDAENDLFKMTKPFSLLKKVSPDGSELKQPIQGQQFGRYKGFFKSGNFMIKASLPRRGFLPDEEVPIKVEIKSDTDGLDVNGYTIGLQQSIVLSNMEQIDKTVCKENIEVGKSLHKNEELIEELKLPLPSERKLSPSMRFNLFEVDYCVFVKLYVNEGKKTETLEIPVTICCLPANFKGASPQLTPVTPRKPKKAQIREPSKLRN